MSKGYTRFGENVEKSFQSVDINSRKELEDIAKEEKLDINFNKWWTLWDKLVEKTKEDITKELEKHRAKEPIYHKNNKPFRTVYIYNLQGELINTFKNTQEAAQYYSISPIVMNNCIRNHMPYYKLNLYISIEEPK